jgi:pimeloyl-ACP methyl ester carboxylesterase
MNDSISPDVDTEWPVRRYRVEEGLELVGDVGGDAAASAVVLLHGGGQTRHSWQGAMRQLVDHGYHVVNVDARGHGDSDWSAEGNYSLTSMARDVQQVVGTLSSKPALVGASMGGAAAMYLLGLLDRTAASALVLVDIVPRVDTHGAARIAAFMRRNPQGFATLDEVAAAVNAYNPQRRHPSDVSGLMRNLRRHSDGRLYWHWDPRFLNSPDRLEPAQFAQQLTMAAAQVQVPSLLVRGLQSDIVSDEGVEDLKRHLPHLEVFDVPDAGHMVAGDRNDAFNAGLLAFLRRRMPGT